jgi:hypothetical protein
VMNLDRIDLPDRSAEGQQTGALGTLQPGN